MDYTVGFCSFINLGVITMKTNNKHKDVFFQLDSVIAERFLESSEEIRASGLKLTKTGKPYVFIKQGFLAEAIELTQLIWEAMSIEAQDKKIA